MNCHWPSLCVLIAGISARFLYLDSDPQYYEWVGYLTDEGRWVQHARSLSLYGKLFDENLDMHFYLAPIYQLVNYLIFELAGVNVFTSRILSSICGSAVLIHIWQGLRNVVTPQALFLCLAFLAFQLDLLVLSRIAVPEMAAILLQVVIYFQIVNGGRSAVRMVLSGALLLLAIGIKATTALLLPICSLVILIMPRRPYEIPRWHALASFWAGFLLPVMLACAVLAIHSPEQIGTVITTLGNLWHNLLRYFFIPSSTYTIIAFPFVDSISPALNLWLLGLWVSALAWKAAERENLDFVSYRYLVTSFVWFACYAGLILGMEYFPTRYKIHVLIPIAICLTVGVGLVHRLGIQAIVEAFDKMRGTGGFYWRSFLCLPTAVVLSPLAASALAYIAVDPERVRIKVACVVVLFAVTMFVVGWCRQNHRVIRFLLVYPLIASMGWAILSTTTGVSFWPTEPFQSQFTAYALMIFVAAGASIVVVRVSIGWGSMECGRLIAACAVVYLPIAVVRVAPGYLNPQYSIRNASRDLGSTVSRHGSIATIRAEGLFNENDLRYKSFLKVDWPVEKPDALVIAFGDVEGMPLVKQNYHLAKIYKISVSQEYEHGGANPATHSPGAIMVSVYMKNKIDP